MRKKVIPINPHRRVARKIIEAYAQKAPYVVWELLAQLEDAIVKAIEEAVAMERAKNHKKD